MLAASREAEATSRTEASAGNHPVQELESPSSRSATAVCVFVARGVRRRPEAAGEALAGGGSGLRVVVEDFDEEGEQELEDFEEDVGYVGAIAHGVATQWTRVISDMLLMGMLMEKELSTACVRTMRICSGVGLLTRT